MANPASVSDSYGEWFEIVNISQSSVDLNGWVIKDAQDNQHTVNNLNSDFDINNYDSIKFYKFNFFLFYGENLGLLKYFLLFFFSCLAVPF